MTFLNPHISDFLPFFPPQWAILNVTSVCWLMNTHDTFRRSEVRRTLRGRTLRWHHVLGMKKTPRIILTNGNMSPRGNVSMTPIGSEIILESAKTNRLLPHLLHSSSPPLTLTAI